MARNRLIAWLRRTSRAARVAIGTGVAEGNGDRGCRSFMKKDCRAGSSEAMHRQGQRYQGYKSFLEWPLRYDE